MGLYTEICKIIKLHRKKSHLTQQELAEKCNFSKSDISRIENEIGNPSIDKLDKILNALEILDALELNVKEKKTKKKLN